MRDGADYRDLPLLSLLPLPFTLFLGVHLRPPHPPQVEVDEKPVLEEDVRLVDLQDSGDGEDRLPELPDGLGVFGYDLQHLCGPPLVADGAEPLHRLG